MTRIIAIVLCLLLVSCKKDGKGKTTPGGTAVTTTDPSPTPTVYPSVTPSPVAVVQPILKLTLKSAYESNAGAVTTKADCSIPAGTASGTTINCSASIPEAELYYSVFQIDLKMGKGSCKVVKFYPYSYQKSSSASFTPEGTSQAVDCSGSPNLLSPECFGGVAKELVTGFPQTRAITAVPTTTWTKSLYITSSHSVGMSSNRRIATDLADRANPISLPGDGYAGLVSSFQDYTLSCLDAGNNVTHAIILTIVQAPGGAGTLKSWTNLPITTPPVTPPPISVQFSTYNSTDTNLQNATTQQKCDVTTGTSATCTFNYSEALLYYSKTKISVNVPPGTCDSFRFYPYYYRASNSNGFTSEWSPNLGAVNCYSNSATANPNCFSGAALSVIPQGPNGQNSFPSNKYLTYFPGNTFFNQNWTVPAAFDSNRKSNRWMANNLPLVNRNSQITLTGDGYAGGGEFQDYLFNCYQNDGSLKYSVHVDVVPNSAATIQDWTSVPVITPPPMNVQLATYWEDDTVKQYPTTQPNPPQALTATVGNENAVYIIPIPKDQLYFSQLQFTLSVPPNTCDIVSFTPYSYLQSRDPQFVPEWNPSSKIDCSVDVPPIECYNGAGGEILKTAGVSYPFFRSIVYFPARNAFGQSWTAPAANMQSRTRNTYTSNTLMNRTVAFTPPPFDSGMLDWTFTCSGTAGQTLYSITLFINPVLSDGTTSESPWLGH